MTTASKAAWALTLGALAGFAVMIMHPTGSDVIAAATAGGGNWRGAFAHGLAIAAQPLLLLGTLYLTSRLAADRDMAVAAFTFYACSIAAVLIAAVASGFISPSVVRGIGEASAAERDAMLAAMRYTGRVNQAFAKVSVGFGSVAILLWSWALLRARGARGLAWFGVLTSLVALAGVVSGTLRLDIHGFGAVVLAQGIWMIWAAAWLRRQHAAD